MRTIEMVSYNRNIVNLLLRNFQIKYVGFAFNLSHLDESDDEIRNTVNQLMATSPSMCFIERLDINAY